ncbi:MAG: hypothetical protein A2V88_15395 [Elusimicrobia bacterium RBG_16_66_12]|nr:MAG: hypothetical protein A2V88_15395 [Elusimicrobia bacterium RBG_16_66_12]
MPEVAAGYWWEAANTTGFGTTGFRVLEGGGHTTFDLIQATVASQPTALAENGGVQFRMRDSGDPDPSTLVTAGSVVAGWTGATGMLGWFRLPDASGDITGTVTLVQHTDGPPIRRMQLNGITGTPDRVGCQTSTDGTANVTERADNTGIFTGSSWVWLECYFDPLFILGGSLAAERVKIFANLLPQTITLTGSVGTTLADSSNAIAIACSVGGLANSDTTDWAVAYYANGIPSLANRVRLANHRNPTGILLT